MIDLIFGRPGLPRFVVTMGYVVACLAGVLLVSGGILAGTLLLSSAIGLILVGTLKEYRDDMAKLDEEEDDE